MFLVVRSSLEDAGLSAAIAREIHAVDPNVVVYGFRTMQDRLYDSLARQRFSSTMLGAFAVFALLLASVGLYGVMSYLVTQSSYAISLLFAAALNCCRMGLRSLWAICSRSATDVSNQYHRCNCRCRGYRPSWRAGGGSIAGSFLRLGKWASYSKSSPLRRIAPPRPPSSSPNASPGVYTNALLSPAMESSTCYPALSRAAHWVGYRQINTRTLWSRRHHPRPQGSS